jgi:hypothetical protein
MADAATAAGVAVIAALQGLTADELAAGGIRAGETWDVEAMRHVRHLLGYPDTDAAAVGSPDSLIVGSSAVMARAAGEQTAG